MSALPDEPTADKLLELVRQFHPAGALDVEHGYDDLPEVRARRAVQRAAADGAAWSELLVDLHGAWPAARVMDWSRLQLDCGRHLRVIRDAAEPDRHLVAWVSLLSAVALIYESRKAPGQRAMVTPPERSHDVEGLRRLAELVEAHGWRVLRWELAMVAVPRIAVGNLLPGEATLAACLFSDNLW